MGRGIDVLVKALIVLIPLCLFSESYNFIADIGGNDFLFWAMICQLALNFRPYVLSLLEVPAK